MKRGRASLPLRKIGVALIFTAFAGNPAAAATRESLACLKLSEITITAAQSIPAGTYTAPDGEVFANMPAFCRAAATLTPTSDSDIGIEVWMPSTTWNGRFEGVGNGGYAGSIPYSALAPGVSLGYATVGTDTGHVGSSTDDGSFALGHPEKIIGFWISLDPFDDRHRQTDCICLLW
jgi:feruloyl esterase